MPAPYPVSRFPSAAVKPALILWELHTGPRRFAELRRGLPGVSEKMLIQQLRELEADELVHREVYRQVPPKMEYSLTDFGASRNRAHSSPSGTGVSSWRA
jgi:DNA-binding HxlR family transcriptional regulator